jgi:hypothetical protein
MRAFTSPCCCCQTTNSKPPNTLPKMHHATCTLGNPLLSHPPATLLAAPATLLAALPAKLLIFVVAGVGGGTPLSSFSSAWALSRASCTRSAWPTCAYSTVSRLQGRTPPAANGAAAAAAASEPQVSVLPLNKHSSRQVRLHAVTDCLALLAAGAHCWLEKAGPHLDPWGASAAM